MRPGTGPQSEGPDGTVEGTTLAGPGSVLSLARRPPSSSGPRRAGRRRGRARGFTLIELMVVVILVAILSALAAPALSRSRNDQLAFDFTRRVQMLFNRARTRATAGSAQLVVADMSDRGKFQLFEAIEQASCTRANVWADAPSWVQGTMATANLRLVEAVNLASATGTIIAEEDIKATETSTAKFVAYCVTPSGRVFVGKGDAAASAITAMQAQADWTFNGILDIRVQSMKGAVLRSVLMSGGSSARILTR